MDNTPRFEARGEVGRAHQAEGAGDHAEQLTRSRVAVPAVVYDMRHTAINFNKVQIARVIARSLKQECFKS